MDKSSFDQNWRNGWKALGQEDYAKARVFFERAHAAGIFSVYHHGKAHYGKLCLALKQGKISAVFGQSFFLVAAILSPLSYLLFKLKLVSVRDPDDTLATGKRSLKL